MARDYAIVGMIELTDEDLREVPGAGAAAGAALGGATAATGPGAATYGVAGFNSSAYTGFSLAPVIATLDNSVGADIGLNLALAVHPASSTSTLVRIG